LLRAETILRVVRYGIVGVATNAAGYVVYLLITFAGAGPKITMSALYATGAALGFLGNRQWAFRHAGGIGKSVVLYFFFHAGGYFIDFALLSIFVDRLGYPHQLVQAVAVMVVALYLFAAFNFVVFRAAPLPRREI
jgi:putative flippase GtrA